MSSETNLESLIEHVDTQTREYDPKLAKKFRKFCVDVSAGWTYFAPPFALAIEPLAGMSFWEIVHSRIGSALAQAALMRPIGVFRKYLSNKFEINEESSKWKKKIVDTVALATFQVPAYAAVLKLSGADKSEAYFAVPVGVAFGSLTGSILGRWMDWWKDLHGIEPLLYRASLKPEKGILGRIKDNYRQVMSIDINPFYYNLRTA